MGLPRRAGPGSRDGGCWTELETQAAQHGARVLRLETNRNLTEAIALYRAAGYTEVTAFNDEAYAHHWFEKQVPGRS